MGLAGLGQAWPGLACSPALLPPAPLVHPTLPPANQSATNDRPSASYHGDLPPLLLLLLPLPLLPPAPFSLAAKRPAPSTGQTPLDAALAPMGATACGSGLARWWAHCRARTEQGEPVRLPCLALTEGHTTLGDEGGGYGRPSSPGAAAKGVAPLSVHLPLSFSTAHPRRGCGGGCHTPLCPPPSLFLTLSPHLYLSLSLFLSSPKGKEGLSAAKRRRRRWWCSRAMETGKEGRRLVRTGALASPFIAR